MPAPPPPPARGGGGGGGGSLRPPPFRSTGGVGVQSYLDGAGTEVSGYPDDARG